MFLHSYRNTRGSLCFPNDYFSFPNGECFHVISSSEINNKLNTIDSTKLTPSHVVVHAGSSTASEIDNKINTNEWLSFGSQDPLPPITTESVAKKLSNINVNKAPDPFDPNMKVIKTFAEHFAVPLADIYNQPFRCKTFPEIWKISNICSVPKSSPCSSVEELRPIALAIALFQNFMNHMLLSGS